MDDAIRNALEYSIGSALQRAPLREFRQLWQSIGDIERLVMAAAVRKHIELEGWRFRRETLLPAEEPGDIFEGAVDEVIATCGGDPRAAIKALLVANEFLSTDFQTVQNATSSGYSRGRLSK